jgi:hypothetical protein
MGQWNLMVVAASVAVASPAAVRQLLPWELPCQGNRYEELVVWLLPLEPVTLREHQKVTKYLNSLISVVTGNAFNVTFTSKFNVIQ